MVKTLKVDKLNTMSAAELVSAFLNLPKVLGVALVKQHRIHSLVVSPQNYKTADQQKLLHVTQKALTDLPSSFDALEVLVGNNYAYLYPLSDDLCVCAITENNNLIIKSIVGRRLQKSLQQNLEATKSDFRALQRQQTERTKINANAADASLTKLQIASPELPEPNLTFAEVNLALNRLSETVCEFLGPKLTVNFWLSSRPDYGWLRQFEVSETTHLTFMGDEKMAVSAVQHLCIREWTRNFMKQCSHIVHDLPSRIENSGMDVRQRKALSIRTLSTEDLSSSEDESLFNL
ncbi:hypothetical protein GS597_14390 [Synechococcales cyanobacterium C]|uniref:Uncharacterized protein n=1 Tax=Petrachloros mirabilis ULC683 TaxID=2781853 RepID=A0A8K2A0T0_9CYAN|nr:hypothetical protein [Petrachloros mirabilis]NCJ07677.1 hypothetical protein [Petrachloros mirabilis ULC683]